MNEPVIPDDTHKALTAALWRVYQRPFPPTLWQGGGNLPWNDPAFSARMLREHLNEAHGAASRQTPDRMAQLDWLWAQLGLQPGHLLLDITCGPGLYAVALARRGVQVTGIDFSPAAIAYARELAQVQGVANRAAFIEADVRAFSYPTAQYDAALFLYGQLAVFPPEEAAALLQNAARALKPGGKLVVELLNPQRIDTANSSWWYTDDSGLWGDGPFLHLGERFWDDAARTSTERYQIIHLHSGRLDEVILCDRAYTPAEITAVCHHSGFAHVQVFPEWDGLPLYDAQEWIVYVAQR